MNFGIHTGQQNAPYQDFVKAWKMADAAGFNWISVWDHFYEAPDRGGDGPTYETVAMMTAAAAATTRARIGVLVMSAGYRPPALLAKMIATLDHISNGRANLGIGAGWHQAEYEAYGYTFPSLKARMDMLEESVQIIQSMLANDTTTFEGAHYRVREAKLYPKPVQAKLPVWVGGGGEKRTIPIAAKHADGWNIAYVPPEVYRRKIAVLDQWCEKFNRDPQTIMRSINTGFYLGTDKKSAARGLQQMAQDGFNVERTGPGMLRGLVSEAVEQIRAFERAGATQMNIAFRPPFDFEAFQAFIEEAVPRFR
ncbi:MAG: TIGR03560 family F420-dependent LLM class oxidoreductase [Chloroflexi bacterium]|nr:TIGR03560 family F420-dependent LLM class oxidoreductase [Chloroflexota bacterium]